MGNTPESPLTRALKVSQVQGLTQATQQAAQEAPGSLVEQQQRIQANQNTLNDQQAATAGMNEWDGKDLNDLPGLVLKHGGSATAVLGLKKNILEQSTALLNNTKEKNAILANNNDIASGKVQALGDLPDEQLGPALTTLAQQGSQDGYIDPQHAQTLQALSQLPPDQIRQHLPNIVKAYQGQGEQFKQAISAQEAQAKSDEAAAKKADAQTTAARYQAELPGGALQAPDKAEMQSWLAAHPGKTAADFLVFKSGLAPQINFNLQNAGVNSAANDPIVDAVGQGKMKIADAIPMRAPVQVRQQFLNKVLAKYPDFNSANYDVEKGVMKDFTSGDAAKSLTAFNTAIEHGNQLSAATDALQNGDVVALNKIGNALGYQFGSDKTTNFNVIKNALSGEISKVFKGGGATDAEIAQVQQPFNNANSPAQLKGAIQTANALMASKRDALKQQYNLGTKAQPNFGQGGASAAAPGVKSGFTRITASDGSVHDIPSDKINAAKQRDPGLKVQQ